MERREVETIIGKKITYTEGNCQYVLLCNNENEITEAVALTHSDAPLLAPKITPDPHFCRFVWDFSEVIILKDSDLDVLTQNIEEIRKFVEKIENIRK